MPISSGPIGLTRMYSHSDGLQTWNQPGLHTNEGVSSLRSMDRPLGAGVARDVNVLFGHAQLIPTYTLQPAEEMKQQQWMDPAVAPAPREDQYAAQAQFMHARAASASYAGEGDTLNQLGLAARQTKWDGAVIKQADRHRPMSASVRGTRRSAAASPSRGGARSRSPSAGRHGLSKRPPLHLSSSALSLTSPTSPRAVKQLDAAAKRDVASGEFHSPNSKDLAQARRYVAQLDRELSANAQQAINEEKRSVLAAGSAASAGSGLTPRKQAEWNRDLMVGMHVRAVGMERKWAEPGQQGMDRIGALYDSSRDPNTSSTQILQSTLRNTVRDSSQLFDPAVSAEDMLNRSSLEAGTLHSPRSGAGVNNITYHRDREQQADSMPDKYVDRGFWASGTRQHEEAHGGKMLLKNRAWPRDPITAAAVGRAASHTGSGTESRSVHGVNTSTTSARVRAQENGELNYDLSASFGPGGPRAAASQHSARGSNFQLANASQTGLTGGATPQQSPSKKKLRPAGSNAKDAQASRNALSPLPYSTSTLPAHSVTRSDGGPQHYSNPHNTSAAALLNNSVTAASAHAQALHAQKFDPRTGALRSRHPRDFADDYLANAHGISVASGMGGLPEDATYGGTGGGLNDSRNLTGASLVAPSHQDQHNIEGNGAILDLSTALAARSKAPWKYGGARGTRKHDRKQPSEEDRVIEEARKKRLPSTQRGAGAATASSGRRRPHSAGASFSGSHAHSHSVAHAHRTGHSLAGGKAGFVTAPMSLKPSLHLSQSGRNILGRTRVTERVDLTDQDWEYMRAKNKAAKAAAYARSQRGPHDPPPHNTSVIEEAMHLEKLARRERSMVAREREWRAQQIWLHEKKKGMDKLAARAKSATRTMPPRPARPDPPASASDDLDVSAAGGGLAKVWSGGPLIAPTYLDSLGRVARDIDADSEVRGKDRLALHAKQQIAAAHPKRGDLTLPHPSSNDQTLEDDWPSKHQLSSEQITNPLLEESKSPQQHSTSAQLYNDSPDDPAARRPGEYELDELELEAQRRRAGLSASNAARDRAKIDEEERKEMQDLYDQARAIAETQDWRERAAERALSGSKSATSNSAPKNDDQNESRWAQERDAEERAQAVSRFNASSSPSSSFSQHQQQSQQPRRSPSNTASTRHPASLNFTSSPHKLAPRGRDGEMVTGGAGEGSRALQAAALYDQRLREMIAFLRLRHPYWSDADRHDRANERARWLVAQELARMGPDGGQVPPIPRQSSKPDWFSEYQLLRAAQEVPPVEVQRQAIEAMSPARASPQDLPEFARSGAVRSHNPFAPQAHLPNQMDDAAQLEEMRKKSAEITARYERMRMQAMEAQKR